MAPQLIVEVVEARDLPNREGLFGKSDPFTVLQLPIQGKTKAFQTKHINNDLNPKWHETFTFENPNAHDSLRVVVFDYDAVGKHDELGQATVPLGTLQKGKTVDTWVQLINPKNKGEIHLKLTAIDFGNQAKS